MVVATYKSNCRSQPEWIRVHKYTDEKLRIEAIGNSYAKEVGGVYNTIEDVEEYLAKRDRVFGYSRT